MNKQFLLLLLAIPMMALSQQKKPTLAFSGSDGIYLKNIFPFCNSSHPLADSTKTILIERKAAGEAGWTRIGNFGIPNNLTELSANFQSASKYGFDASFMKLEDAGAAFSILEQTMQWDSAASFLMNNVTAIALGFYYVDETASRGKTYEYRFTKSGTSSEQFITNTVVHPDVRGFARAKANQVQPAKSSLGLQWFTVKDRKPVYVDIYRRTGYFGEFEKILAEQDIYKLKPDTVKFIIRDRSVVSNEEYSYFIIPTDPYGNKGTASDTITIFSNESKEIDIPDHFSTEPLEKDRIIRLKWKLNNPQMVSTVEIYKSKDYNGEFNLIANVSARDTSYSDPEADPMTTYYYYLKVFDKTGKKSVRSIKTYGLMSDKNAPEPPYGLKAENSTTGIKLSWLTEQPLITGYFVFRGEGIDGRAVQISELIPATDSTGTYIDTASNLNGYHPYTYTVTQINTSHMISKKSLPVYIKSQRNSASVQTPMNLMAVRTGNSVMLFWDDATRADESITGYNVYRKTLPSSEFTKISKVALLAGMNHFTDSISAGSNYVYSIESISASGRKSTMSATTEIKFPYPIPAPPANLHAYQAEQGVSIDWLAASGNAPVKSYKIYRREKGDQEEKMIRIQGDETSSFTDETATKGKVYYYRVSAVGMNDEESVGGETASVVME